MGVLLVGDVREKLLWRSAILAAMPPSTRFFATETLSPVLRGGSGADPPDIDRNREIGDEEFVIDLSGFSGVVAAPF